MTNRYETLKQTFSSVASGRQAVPYDEFINWALYHPEIGYYTSPYKRVGKSSTSDFYTSTSLGSTWGQLIVDATCKLLEKYDPSKFIFVEIAAEPDENLLSSLNHPFREFKTICLGDKMEIPSPAIVFSNEWLDARPFKRFRFESAKMQWVELGVKSVDNLWHETILPDHESSLEITKTFPQNLRLPYTIDWSTGANQSLDNLLNLEWNGIFLTFDYGLSKERILNDFPEGTSRSYYRHSVNNKILEKPGEQDITCHVCWDSLQDLLSKHDFSKINLQTQESFFMHHAQKTIKQIIEKPKVDEDKLGLIKEMLHPHHLGHKFQALHAKRGL